MFGRTFSRHKIVGRVDQRDMGECLRKISELALQHGIVFLGQQANVVAQIEQPHEEIPRLLMAAGQRKVIRQPKCARQEGSLTRRQAINTGLGRVPEHQAAVEQLSLDCADG